MAGQVVATPKDDFFSNAGRVAGVFIVIAIAILAAFPTVITGFVLYIAGRIKPVAGEEYVYKLLMKPYGTLFFAITGFHGLHVLVGLVMNGWLQYYAWRGRFDSDHYVPVEAVTLYWHFVDLVWIFIFCTLYLSPPFWP